MSDTTIEWTDKTWNPVSGCTKVSAGCKNCYAERVFPRAYHRDIELSGSDQPRRRDFTDVRIHPDRLDQPLRWRKPARVFVNSMSDLFHEDVPDDFIFQVYRVMGHARQHTFQILTKRPQRMLELQTRWRDAGTPIANVWLGVSCEDQKTADERIPLLLQTPAAVRFVSAEPLLGPIDFIGKDAQGSALHPYERDAKLDWLIIGGESGPNARPFNLQWGRDIIEQCKAANVPVFFKQVGSNSFYTQEVGTAKGEGFRFHDINDRKGGDPAEWPEDLRVREFPA